MPVNVRSDGLTGRMYQKFVTRMPRCVVRMRSSTLVPMGRSPDRGDSNVVRFDLDFPSRIPIVQKLSQHPASIHPDSSTGNPSCAKPFPRRSAWAG